MGRRIVHSEEGWIKIGDALGRDEGRGILYWDFLLSLPPIYKHEQISGREMESGIWRTGEKGLGL